MTARLKLSSLILHSLQVVAGLVMVVGMSFPLLMSYEVIHSEWHVFVWHSMTILGFAFFGFFGAVEAIWPDRNLRVAAVYSVFCIGGALLYAIMSFTYRYS